ncbi:serralysin [uncultured Gammaproteobacteria bacterium]
MDTINEAASADAGDVLQLKAGTLLADLRLTRSGYGLVAGLEGGDQVTITNQFNGTASRIESLRFDDGTAWDLAGTQVKLGGTGNDTLAGTAGNDVLFSDGGNDTLNAGAGDDVLSGGVGTDALNGGLGDDTYLFRRGEGQDTIADTGGQDRLLLGANIAPDQVWLSHTGSDLVIDLVGGSDRVTIRNWYTDPANQIETLATRDGWSLAHTQVDQLVAAMAAFAPPSGIATALPTDVAAAVAPVIAANWQHAA